MSFFKIIQRSSYTRKMSNVPKFMYFAYGSNLSTDRIHFQNPTAIRKGFGELKNYRLDFITYTRRWKGASATIVPTTGASVWGTIWEINQEDMTNLDRQEGVHANIYFPFEVDIITPSGVPVKCRVYQQTVTPENLSEGEVLPTERRPSKSYLNCIVSGAEETGLPNLYIEQLKKIPFVDDDGDINLNIE